MKGSHQSQLYLSVTLPIAISVLMATMCGHVKTSTWQKVGGNVILQPVYVKKVGRPPKSRKKQPYEVQGSHGPRLTKHGIQMTCRYCGDKGHNRATCSMRKAGLPPKIPT